MPLDNIANDLRAVKTNATNCAKPADVARSLQHLQSVLGDILQDIRTEIINIINTGGGGTTPVYIIRALVNNVGGLPGSQTTFNFDGATDVFTFNGAPSGVTSGTAQNIQGRAFQDNEPVILTSFNGTIWLADKIDRDINVISARVDEAGGVITTDSTFDFDNAAALIGVAPAGGTGTAVNSPATAYADDEVVVLFQADNGTWRVLQDDDDLGGGGGSYSAGFGLELTSTTFSIDDNGYDSEAIQVLTHDTGTVEWKDVDIIEVDLN